MDYLYLGLGSNLGDREKLLHQAIGMLTERIGGLERLSAFYETKPWGFCSPHPFLNAVGVWRTAKSPEELLRATQAVERELGRRRKSVEGQYADRPIDIDLLLYGGRVIEADYGSPEAGSGTVHLSLPHPLMHLRRFVMEPLAEVAPDVVHPVLKRTCREILQEITWLADKGK